MGPVVFDNCRGWLHPGASRRGIVICGAHGFEDLCSRTSLAILAETIAARGCPVLRFDWRGAGDSEGDEGGEDRAAVWLLNVAAAVRTLIAQTGVDEIVLVGLRLGALLALHAAPDIRPCKLVLLAPPASGRAFVREIEMMARIFPSGGDAAYDGLDVAGFRIARATLDQLRAFKTQDIANLAGLDTLLMGPDDDGGPLKASLTNAGLALRVAPFEGYAQMMCDPTAATPPAAALARIADFCVEGARPARAPKTPASGGVLQTSQWREEAAQFGQDKQLVGIFCAPVAGAAGARTIVFLNAGGVYHVGWARMTVEMARRLAQAGIASLRMDLSGVGDSLAASGPDRAPLYRPGMTRNVTAALDWLERKGVGEIALFGACSGAYQAFHAARQDARVRKLAMVNPLCFVYGPAYALQIEAWRRTKSTDMALKQSAAQTSAHEDARTRLFQLAKSVVKVGLAQAADMVALLRRHAPGGANVERWFELLSARGAQTMLIYSENDSGLIELERHLGARSRADTPLPGVRKTLIPDSDHEITPRAARARLAEILDRFMAA